VQHVLTAIDVSRFRRHLAIIVATAGLALAGAAAPAGAAQLPQADRDFVDATVAQAMQTGRLPGVMIRISGPMGTYKKVYGVADLRSGTPMAAAQHVRIASITKSFTATAVLRQIQRGRLSLSDKLSHWVKGIPNGRRITIRQLLAMRSGIYDFTSDRRFTRDFDANPLMRFAPQDVVRIVRRHKPLFAPGARTQYADSNYVLLGIILEKLTGRSVESLIQRDVVRPARLRETSFPTRPTLPKPFAHGYYAGDDGNGELRDYTAVNPKVAWTAGGMVSTLDDLKRWGKVLATGTLLSRKLQAQRLRFGKIPNPGPPVGYGLGILRFGDWLGHDGAIFGFSTATFYERSTGAQIVAVANLSSNFSTPTLEIFGIIAQHLYPASLR
jgi:D-alanyl-D-alanine carboxypeptidase